MASGTSDRSVVLDQEADESSLVLDLQSIQASLPRTSSVVSENIAAGDDRSAGTEPSLPAASSKNSEIVEAEADPSTGMEPPLQTTSPMRDPAEDEQSSGTGSTKKVNPFMKDISEIKNNRGALEKHFSELKQKLKVGLEKEAVYAFLEHNRLTETLQREDYMTKAQEKVQELFDLFEAIEHVIKLGEEKGMTMERLVREPQAAKKVSDQQNFKECVCRIDIYYHLFVHALKCARSKLGDTENEIGPDGTHSRSKPKVSTKKKIGPDDTDYMIVAFMAFLINKVQEKDIKDPSLAFQKHYQEAKTKVTDYLRLYEEETISAFICLVNSNKNGLAVSFFESVLELMKPSDIINRGRVYNYALQEAEDLHKVYKFLRSPERSRRYNDIVRADGGLVALNKNPDQDKVRNFLWELYDGDDDLQKKIKRSSWKFIEQHDYPYLMKSVWEHEGHNERSKPKYQTWTPLQINYIFTSSAAIFTVGGQKIMEHLLQEWPALVNAPYKGVAALHVAVFKGNEEAIDYLLKQKELDINVRTGRLLTVTDEVQNRHQDRHQDRTMKQKEVDIREWTQQEITDYENELAEEALKISEGEMNCKCANPLPHASIVVGDREEMFEDLLRQPGVGGSPDSRLPDATKFIRQRNKIAAGKKWNKNRWNLPAHQTALHVATTQAESKAVKLLCDAPEPHQQRLRCHEEDEENHTPLDILYNWGPKKVAEDFHSAEIEKILLSKQDVKDGLTRMLQTRQSLVEAVNTILVGAALIASVTFAGWLSPPLGYAQDYADAVPYPAPPGTYDSYLAVQGNLGVKAFAIFNSLSFFFGIATVIVGADATFPHPADTYIGHAIKDMRPLLRRAIKFFIISLVCVLGAFGSAAVVVLPPSLFFRKDFILSIVVGGVVCGYALWQFLSRHYKKARHLNEFIVKHVARINKFTNVF